MRSITIMYDSLNRHLLEAYGSDELVAPNFKRLADKCKVFDKFYGASLPCMPARRELHTGRTNFLHRSWGPVEPFDRSAFAILRDSGVYTHFISDHAHYWQEGGLTYHTRYSTAEMIRGQEGDFWQGDVLGYHDALDIKRQDSVNRRINKDLDHTHVRVYKSGMKFLERNKDRDNWHLHIEFFDPHEPFFAPEEYKKLYDGEPFDHEADWPEYRAYDDKDMLHSFRNNYKALVSMCDEYLGKLLDFMDDNDMWKDTMLICNTDHGFMLGEHGYAAKNYMPMYEEVTHLPFFIWDPVSGNEGPHRIDALCNTPDIAPTLLDYHNVPIPAEMTGRSLLPIIRENRDSEHRAVIFGEFGKHVNVTDGRYVYMRAGRFEKLNEYTLLPLHIYRPFSAEELRDTEMQLDDSFSFTQGIPVMKIPATTAKAPDNSSYWYDRHMAFGDLLFDLEKDPRQDHPIHDEKIERHMIDLLIETMKIEDAPKEQYERLGLTEYMEK